ncbi:hypothetical protein JVU11DRAFT_7765 [Chiua virens]|nr:hypothetical protein JVU11DRAFT_7765 [Chiua virens]
MWKRNLVAALHSRTPSETPLLRSEGSRPISTATLEPVQEQDATSTHQHQHQPVPSVTLAPPQIATNSEKHHMSSPTTSGKASPTIPVMSKNELVVAANRDLESTNSQGMSGIRAYLMEELDMTQAAPPLSAYCFMTGFIDAVCFTAVYVCFHSPVARLFNGSGDYSFHISDQQALCSLLSFIFGAFIGRLGDKIGCKTRGWMALGTFFQALFTMIGAICVWKSNEGAIASSRGDPAWVNVLSFVTIGAISASVGLQGIMAKRLNTQYTTTVVLTTTWCELVTEPELFNLRRLVKSRDHKAVAILCLFLGGFIGRAVLDKIGDAGTLGVGTGVRFLISIWWLLAPAKNAKQ